MKKTILISVAAFFALFASSCTNIYEEAYALEANYHYLKNTLGGSAAELEYKEKFMELWLSMTDKERAKYKAYRERMNKESKSELERLRSIEAEGHALLNK